MGGWKIFGLIAGVILAAGIARGDTRQSYQVESVKGGAVQLKNVSTGMIENVHDDRLVSEALSGALKAGDIVKR